jgi:hypothetical protein
MPQLKDVGVHLRATELTKSSSDGLLLFPGLKGKSVCLAGESSDVTKSICTAVLNSGGEMTVLLTVHSEPLNLDGVKTIRFGEELQKLRENFDFVIEMLPNCDTPERFGSAMSSDVPGEKSKAFMNDFLANVIENIPSLLNLVAPRGRLVCYGAAGGSISECAMQKAALIRCAFAFKSMIVKYLSVGTTEKIIFSSSSGGMYIPACGNLFRDSWGEEPEAFARRILTIAIKAPADSNGKNVGRDLNIIPY